MAPIAPEQPCGANLAYDILYGQIKDLKNERDTRAIEGGEPVKPQWSQAAEMIIQALTTKTKDLQLAGWLTQCLVELDGFAGLREGLKVTRGFVEKFWDGVFPTSVEEDPAARQTETRELRIERLADFGTLGGGLMLPNRLLETPIAQHPADDPERPALNFSKSRTVKPKSEGEKDADFNARRDAAEARGRKFDTAVAATANEFYVALHQDTQEALAEIGLLEKAMQSKLAKESPGLSALRSAAVEVEAFVKRICKERGLLAPPPAAVAPAGEEKPATNGKAEQKPGGPPTTREEAFRRLEEVADFLRKSEPHSPVPLLIRRAIGWKDLGFDQLLTELIKDAGSRGQVGELLGIKAPEDPKKK